MNMQNETMIKRCWVWSPSAWYSIIYTITWSLIIGEARPPCWIIGGSSGPPRFLLHCLGQTWVLRSVCWGKECHIGQPIWVFLVHLSVLYICPTNRCTSSSGALNGVDWKRPPLFWLCLKMSITMFSVYCTVTLYVSNSIISHLLQGDLMVGNSSYIGQSIPTLPHYSPYQG